VTSWLRGVIAGARDAGPDRLSIRRDGSARLLEFSFVGQAGPGEYLVRVVETAVGGNEARLRQRFSITAREAEVLLWVSRGKQNRDIAEILGMSPRTVNKHLEQVYTKIGVENRAAAAATALGALRDTN
jgi:DNA-binding CsgD family transcriptional regulator